VWKAPGVFGDGCKKRVDSPAGCQELVRLPPQTLPFQCWLQRRHETVWNSGQWNRGQTKVWKRPGVCADGCRKLVDCQLGVKSW
jgi:hypothetical protein